MSEGIYRYIEGERLLVLHLHIRLGGLNQSINHQPGYPDSFSGRAGLDCDDAFISLTIHGLNYMLIT